MAVGFRAKNGALQVSISTALPALHYIGRATSTGANTWQIVGYAGRRPMVFLVGDTVVCDCVVSAGGNLWNIMTRGTVTAVLCFSTLPYLPKATTSGLRVVNPSANLTCFESGRKPLAILAATDVSPGGLGAMPTQGTPATHIMTSGCETRIRYGTTSDLYETKAIFAKFNSSNNSVYIQPVVVNSYSVTHPPTTGPNPEPFFESRYSPTFAAVINANQYP